MLRSAPRSWLSLVSLAAFAALLLVSAWLLHLERTGPAHADLTLEGGIPATLFLPAPADAADPLRGFNIAPPPEARPPVVLLAHGFSSDRVGLASLARRLARTGFAALTLDLRGHGQNRNPFPHGRGRADWLAADLAAAVDFLRTTPLVDGSRIAVMGHSMGAAAVLDFASRDSGLDAVIPVAGGTGMLGPQRPPNVLFVYAERDPERVKRRVTELAARLAGSEDLPAGETRGDFLLGTAVRRVEIAGEDHASVVSADGSFAEIVAWLGTAFGLGAGVPPAPVESSRALVTAMLLLVVLVLPGLGLLIGRLTPTTEHLPDSRRAPGLVLLAGALVLALPLASLGNPAAILSIEVGDVIVMLFALAGIPLLLALHLRDRAQFASLFATPGASLLGAALGIAGIYVLLQPLGASVHRFSLTPERTLVFALATAGLLPLSLAMQMLLRRGRPLAASLASLAGRALVVLALVAGVVAGVLAPVVQLMLPAFAMIFLLAEVLAASLYSVSRNLLAIALIDAAWLALVLAAIMPVRI